MNIYLLGACIVIIIVLNFAFRKTKFATRMLYAFGIFAALFLILVGLMYYGWNYGDASNRGNRRPPEVKYLHVVNKSKASRFAVLAYVNQIGNDVGKISDTLSLGNASHNNTAVFELPLVTGDSVFLKSFSLEILDSTRHSIRNYNEAQFLKESQPSPVFPNKRKADLWIIDIK